MKESIEAILSCKRHGGSEKMDRKKESPVYRSPFHRDYDRIVFSNSFRRLAKKTQMHPLARNDHIHTRMTHSLEVASVGRSLGLYAGNLFCDKYGVDVEPYDVAYIVQSACIAHDIGNPPFGHAGEEVIKEWFAKNEEKEFLRDIDEEDLRDFRFLDGNAQGFRVVSQLENHMFNGGMRLTYATLGSLVKYPYGSERATEEKSKFGFYRSERKIAEEIFQEMGLVRNGELSRHPLSYLMEVADDICYGLLDIQDAIEMKIIQTGDVERIFELLCGKETLEILHDTRLSPSSRASKLVADGIHNLAIHAMNVFEKHFEDMLEGRKIDGLLSLFEDGNLREGLSLAKDLARRKIFTEQRKIELELGAYNIIETLLGVLVRAAHAESSNNLSFRDKRALELMREDRPDPAMELHDKYRRIIDYITGMTDDYARYIAHQLNGMGY